eukprot:TRINITY_DN2501_c0_g1_i2.p1 TRINITY_DN2501_c0_g1~~TRINITY_DN2501_c0_g1_i2.p1  ORF type:complete len:138 (+),score=35.65 TRINITY_DN2501_c0_g1_i2:236-649(+)
MELLAVDAVCDHQGNYHILELNGSAIGIKSQFWKEDSEAIVELAIDKMNKVYCNPQAPDDSVDNQMNAQEWLEHNKTRGEQLQEMRKLKLELEYERMQIQQQRQEPLENSFSLVPLLGALAIGIGLGWGLSFFRVKN